MPKMNYCNDTHKQAVVAYSGQECPLCVSNRRLIEMADAREDIDQQAIQELSNEVDALTKRVKALERAVSPVKADNIWNSQFTTDNGL
jgi:polyhydroxyalkanoate synthesis regulator phasin